jgi:type I restriction enzyme R subunit
MPTLTEADTCRKYVLPKLYAARWDDDRISEQKTFTDGRIVVVGNRTNRRPQKRADYLLRYRTDFSIAVVEAKAAYKNPGDGLQQAKEYAQTRVARSIYQSSAFIYQSNEASKPSRFLRRVLKYQNFVLSI